MSEENTIVNSKILLMTYAEMVAYLGYAIVAFLIFIFLLFMVKWIFRVDHQIAQRERMFKILMKMAEQQGVDMKKLKEWMY